MFALSSILASSVFIKLAWGAGGSSDVICLSSFNWMLNKAGQTPCLVAADLIAVCGAKDSTIDYLPASDDSYSSAATPCECNTVVYNLVSACALCQGGLESSWDDWIVDCTTIQKDIVPPGVGVPHWAIVQDPSVVGAFNPVQAEEDGDGPETFSGKSKHTNVAAIAGGVAGGVVGLALIGGLIFFVIRRKKASARVNANVGIPNNQQQQQMDDKLSQVTPPKSPMYDQATVATLPYTNASSPAPYDPNDPSTHPSSPYTNASSPAPYNPNDPSTHPSSPTFHVDRKPVAQSVSHMSYQSTAPAGSVFSGAPEI